MKKENGKFGVAVNLTLATVFAALVFVVTSQIPPIPIPATGLADIYLGYVYFAPGTLIIKGVEGAIVGFLNIKLKKPVPNPTVRAIISVIAGGTAIVVGYFLYETLLAMLFPSLEIYAIAEIPLNIAQMLIGLIIAVPIMHAVQRIFPQLKSQI